MEQDVRHYYVQMNANNLNNKYENSVFVRNL